MCTDLKTDAFANIAADNKRAAERWSAGGADYDQISKQIADAIDHGIDRLDVKAGEKVLDVATGTGWAARRLSAHGAKVTGIDFSAELIRAARRLDNSANIFFRIADAEALPFAEQEFDGVTSTFGVMFCNHPAKAASELARVCKPGGRLVLTVWEKHGGAYEMFKIIERHNPNHETRSSSPFNWSAPERLQELLGDTFEFGIERGTSFYREKDAHRAWQVFSKGFGPVRSLLARLDHDAAAQFRQEFESFHERHRTAVGILVPRPYVVVVGRRRH